MNKYRQKEKENNIKYIFEHYKTMTHQAISEKLGISLSYVKKLLYQNGMIKRPIKEFPKEDIEFILNNYPTMTILELCKKFSTFPRKIRRVLKDHDIILPRKYDRAWVEKGHRYILKHYKTLSEKELSEKTGLHYYTIRQYLKRKGLTENNANSRT